MLESAKRSTTLEHYKRTTLPLSEEAYEALPLGFCCLLVDEMLLESPDSGTAVTAPKPVGRGNKAEMPARSPDERLVIYAIPRNAQRFTIGRRSHNDVSILDRRISGVHAEIACDDDGFWLTDLRSANGTFLRGAALVPGTRQRIALGTTFVLAHVPVSLLEREQLPAGAVRTSVE